MSDRVQNDILLFVKKFRNAKRLNVIWYGGEPTLSIDIIKNLSFEFQKIFDNYTAYMITNGYNLNKLVDYIDSLNIAGMQITLDRIKEMHDQTRCLSTGKGSFDKIISNINMVVKKTKANIVVRMNVSKNNSELYADLYRFLNKEFGNKVHLYPAFVHDYTNNCQTNICYDNGLDKANYIKNV